MELKDYCDKLEDLYSLTGHDWVLDVSHILTEPTCPTATIRPERTNMVRYRVDRDTIEEAIQVACDLVQREVILRETIRSDCPFTNPDDAHYDKWIVARLAGNDEKLPSFPGTIPYGYEAAVDEFFNEYGEQICSKIKDSKQRDGFWPGYISARLGYKFPHVRIDREKSIAIIQKKLDTLMGGE